MRYWLDGAHTEWGRCTMTTTQTTPTITTRSHSKADVGLTLRNVLLHRNRSTISWSWRPFEDCCRFYSVDSSRTVPIDIRRIVTMLRGILAPRGCSECWNTIISCTIPCWPESGVRHCSWISGCAHLWTKPVMLVTWMVKKEVSLGLIMAWLNPKAPCNMLLKYHVLHPVLVFLVRKCIICLPVLFRWNSGRQLTVAIHGYTTSTLWSSQVTRHLTSRFQPSPTLIKQRIEKLIERESEIQVGHQIWLVYFGVSSFFFRFFGCSQPYLCSGVCQNKVSNCPMMVSSHPTTEEC